MSDMLLYNEQNRSVSFPRWFPRFLLRIMKQNALAKWLNTFLTHLQLPWIAMTVGMLLASPSLVRGWGFADDIMQRDMILTSSLPETLTSLFTFLDPATTPARMDAGVLPWWTLESAQVKFFRPLAAFSLWLDYKLWPDSSFLTHLHSILWYGALCLVAAILYRRLAGNTSQTGLAAILFALSVAHIGCVFSLAARNLLMTGFFGLLAIVFHDCWRKDSWRAGAFLASFCLVLSLLSAESGVATIAYLAAYALFLDDRGWKNRILSVAPYILISVVWWLAYTLSGYGAWGSDFYLNPGREPLAFIWGIITRAPLVLLGQWVLPDPVLYSLLSFGAKTIYWALAVGILVFIADLLLPIIKMDRLARFWCGGMLLAVLPVCAVSLPSGRHLVFISLGAFGLMGQFILAHLQVGETLPEKRWEQRAAKILSIIFLVLHAGLYPISGALARPLLDHYASAVTDLGPLPSAETQDVVIANTPDPGQLIYIPAVRHFRGQEMPAHLRVLAPGFSSITLTRVDEQTLIVQPEEGYLLSPAVPTENRLFYPFADSSYGYQFGDGLFRGIDYPMQLGEQVELTGMQVTVISMTEDDRPLEAEVTFTRILEDEHFIWLMWDWETSRYEAFEPPAVGETSIIPGPFDESVTP